MNLVEYNGIYFSDATPPLLRDVICDCIERKVLVHILTGDPLTGVVTPHINSVGYIVTSAGKMPQPTFKTRCLFTPDGNVNQNTEYRTALLSTERILKVTEVDTCTLLYQSYECKCSPLKYIKEVKVSPYGDVSEKAKIVCANPPCELFVPLSMDVIQLCDFIFGKTHYLPGLFDDEPEFKKSE